MNKLKHKLDFILQKSYWKSIASKQNISFTARHGQYGTYEGIMVSQGLQQWCW